MTADTVTITMTRAEAVELACDLGDLVIDEQRQIDDDRDLGPRDREGLAACIRFKESIIRRIDEAMRPAGTMPGP